MFAIAPASPLAFVIDPVAPQLYYQGLFAIVPASPLALAIDPGTSLSYVLAVVCP
ncbi:MAG: hypothetical protein ICV85_01500 [Tolypothrix sp. T3-bin4]|nr:hypothetical protein [Tolypothrix sp. T3-bin4]